MSSGDSFEFNAQNLGNGQVNQGKNVNAVQNVSTGAGPAAITFLDFSKELRDSLADVPEEQREYLSEVAIGPLEAIAAEPEPANEEEQASLRGRIASAAAHLVPYVPYIRKTIAAFGEGAIKAIAPPASWVIGGVLEVLRDARQD